MLATRLQISTAVSGEAFAESRTIRNPLRGAQALRPMVEPVVLPPVSHPVTGGPFDPFDDLEIDRIGLQPVHERRPLPQQALVSYLDRVRAGAPIEHQKPRLD